MIRYAAATGHVSPATVRFFTDIGKVAEGECTLTRETFYSFNSERGFRDSNSAVGYAARSFGGRNSSRLLPLDGLPAFKVFYSGATGTTVPARAGNARFEHTACHDHLRRDPD